MHIATSFSVLFFFLIVAQAAPQVTSIKSPVDFNDLLQKNLEQHQEIRAYRKELEAARAKSNESFWLGDTNLSIARAGTESPLGGGPNAQTELGITQNFYWPGKNHSLTRIAEIEAVQVNIDLEKKGRQIEKETALLYSQLLNISQKENIARQKITTLNAAKQITSRNVLSGLAVAVDDNLIKREIELTQLQIDQLISDRTQREIEIEIKIPGAKIGTDSVRTAAVIPRSYFQAKNTEASDLSLRMFSFNVEKSLVETKLRRQSIWPDLSLNLTRKNQSDYSVGLGLTIPLWYPFKQSKQIASAEGLAQASQLRLDYQKQVAPLTETLLRAKIQSLKAQIQGRKRIISMISDSTLKQARLLFERGRIDWKQLQLVINAVFEDQEKFVDLDLDLFSAQLDLYERLGVIE